MGASGTGMDIDATLIGPTQPNRRFAPETLSSYSMPYVARKGKPEATTSTWSEPPCAEFLAYRGLGSAGSSTPCESDKKSGQNRPSHCVTAELPRFITKICLPRSVTSSPRGTYPQVALVKPPPKAKEIGPLKNDSTAPATTQATSCRTPIQSRTRRRRFSRSLGERPTYQGPPAGIAPPAGSGRTIVNSPVLMFQRTLAAEAGWALRLSKTTTGAIGSPDAMTMPVRAS